MAASSPPPQYTTEKQAVRKKDDKNEVVVAHQQLLHGKPAIVVPKESDDANKDCWRVALRQLDKVDQDRLQELLIDGKDHIGVLSELIATVNEKKDERLGRKRWLLGRGGKAVDIRALYERIALWVNKFRAIGDSVVQYDPAHAVLPWAAVRFVLQVTAQSVEALGSALQLAERTTHIVTRSAVVEQLYLGPPPVALSRTENAAQWYNCVVLLKQALVALYTEILVHLAQVLHYFRQGSAKHVLSAVFSTPDSQQARLDTLTILQERVDSHVALAESIKSELNNRLLGDLDSSLRSDIQDDLESIKNQEQSLFALLKELQDPISRLGAQIQAIHDGLQLDTRLKLLNAISNTSDVPFKKHHDEARYSRLESSGGWLLDHPTFELWKKPDVKQVLSITGIPGCGKTKLSSLVVDEMKNECSGIAHFYCSRNPAEPKRGEAEWILRSLVRQLACTETHSAVLDPIRKRFQDAIDGLEPLDQRFWSLEELTEVMTELVTEYTSVCIAIDAADEIDDDNRADLLDCLQKVFDTVHCPIKIFIASRDSVNVAAFFEDCLRIQIHHLHNEQDISAFVNHSLDKLIKTRKLLKGKITEPLKQEIRQTLSSKAQGMFRWAELQLESMKSHISARELKSHLGRLPDSLDKTYWDLLEPMLEADNESKRLALSALQFLMCSHATITVEAFNDFVRFADSEFLVSVPDLFEMADNVSFDEEILIESCSNLVVARGIKESGKILGFAHLSVREFLESLTKRSVEIFSPKYTHSKIAKSCLMYLIVTYTQNKGNVGPIDVESAPFLPFAVRRTLFHIDAACAEGHDTEDLIDNLEQTYELVGKRWLIGFGHTDNMTYLETTSLFTLVCSQGYTALAEGLLNRGADVNGNEEEGIPLVAVTQAVWIRHPEHMVKLLVQNGANVMQKGESGKTALHQAAVLGTESVIPLLLASKTATAREQLLAKDAFEEIPLHLTMDRPHVIPLLLGHECSSEQLLAPVGQHFKYRQGTILRLAAMYGEPEAFRHLISHDREITQRLFGVKWTSNQSIMHEIVAGSWGANSNSLNRPNLKMRLAQLAMDFSPSMNDKDELGQTPLALVEKTPPFRNLALFLVQQGSDPEAKDNKGDPAISGVDAIRMDCLELLQKAVENEPRRIKQRYEKEQMTLLHLACQLGRLHIATYLIDRMSDLDTADVNGSTALHLAAFGGHTAIVRKLVQKGAMPQLADRDGLSAMDIAVIGNSTETAREIYVDTTAILEENLPSAATVNTKVAELFAHRDTLCSKQSFVIPDWRLENNHDIIHHARNNMHDNVKTILDRKLCSIEYVDPRWHKTALHWTAESGFTDIVQLLLDYGADTSAQDDFGNTPLHYATEKGYLETSKKLVAGGSPLDVVDGWNRTPLQCAQQRREYEVAEWLEEEIAAAIRERRISVERKGSETIVATRIWSNSS